MRSNRLIGLAGTLFALLLCALLVSGNVARADEKKKEEKAPPPRPAPRAAPGRPGPAAPAQPRNTTAPVNRPVQPTPSMRPSYPPASAPNRYPAANPRPSGPVAGPTRNGGQITTSTNGRAEYRGRDNSRAVFGRDGAVREVRTQNMVIAHGPGGSRRIVADRPDHSRIVAYGNSRGYVQRPFAVGGHSYYQRNYYVGGRLYTRVYRPYSYGGVSLFVYTPTVYYRPAFYGWAVGPWGVPVAYQWGWGGSPWYGAYGGYFTPYPVYPSASYWLTDYVVAANLQDAYQAQAAVGYQPGPGAYPPQNGPYPPQYGQAGMTPDVKQAIDAEVQRQLALEAQAPQADPNAPPPLFDTNPHVFIVSGDLDLTDAYGRECFVTQGDVLAMNGPPPPGAVAASVSVMASKGAGQGQPCARGSVVSVSVEDLMEMQNHMRETIDQGLAQLQSQQGRGGLPPIPAAARGEMQSPIAAAAPQPDPNVAAEVNAQAQEANRAEQQVMADANPNGAAPPPDAGAPPPPDTGAMPQPGGPSYGPPPGSPSNAQQPMPQTEPAPPDSGPKTISMGQTPDQVVAILGQPSKIIDLGSKKTYIYSDMRVIFVDGKVADVQ